MANTDQHDIVNALQGLIDKSVKANAAFLEESGKIFTGLLSKKLEPQDIQELNHSIVNDAVKNFITMNIRHTENLMDFGVNVSRSIVSFIDRINKNNGGAASPGKPGGASRSQIRMAVAQGGQVSSAFFLNSHNSYAQNGNFHFDEFVDSSTGARAPLSMIMSPAEFVLEPAQSLKIEVMVAAPKSVVPGMYKTTVRLNGMDKQEFDIAVEVTAVQAALPPKKTSRPISKGTSKKPSRKTGKKS
jgi:hypothetical protein